MGLAIKLINTRYPWSKIDARATGTSGRHRSQNFTLCCAIEQFPSSVRCEVRCHHILSPLCLCLCCVLRNACHCVCVLCHSVPLYVCVKLCCTIYIIILYALLCGCAAVCVGVWWLCGGCVAVQLCSVLTIKNRLSMSLPTLSLGCVRMSSLDDGDGLHYLSSVLCVNRAIVLNHFCLSCDKLDVQRVASKPRSKHLPHDMQHYQ
jgi:hypothetical protein